MAGKKTIHGDGSIFERKDGRWCAKYKGRTVYAKSEKEARSKLKQLRVDDANGKVPPSRKKLSVYFWNWFDTFYCNNHTHQSCDSTENIFQNRVEPFLGDFRLCDVTTDDIQKLMNSLREEGYSYAYTRRAFIVLSELFKHAYVVEDLQKNPMDRITLLKKDKYKPAKKIVPLESSEVQLLEEVARRKNGRGNPLHRHGNVIVLMLNTGMRIGETRGLRWQDVDLENKVIHIRNSLVNYRCKDEDTSKTNGKKTMVELKSPKSFSGIRDIPLNAKAIEALREIKQYAQKHGYESEFVGCTAKGNPLGKDPIVETLERMARDAGIQKPVNPHLLRHTFATRILSNEVGVDLAVASKMLGHSRVSTTHNSYVHVLQEMEQQAVKLLEKL
ncbi:MAG: site-specific integrase [Neobacillus sp.]|jgi:integrase|nr:site-specific integrase [Neobacillus sp.]